MKSFLATSRKDLIGAQNSIMLGEKVYSSLKPTNQLSSVIDYQITECTASEGLTSTDDGIVSDGLEFDLITVRPFTPIKLILLSSFQAKT